MYESISKNNELENEMTLDMSYFWYSDVVVQGCLQQMVYLLPVQNETNFLLAVSGTVQQVQLLTAILWFPHQGLVWVSQLDQDQSEFLPLHISWALAIVFSYILPAEWPSILLPLSSPCHAQHWIEGKLQTLFEDAEHCLEP